MTQHEFDERDAEILAQREAELNAIDGPRVGDWIRFSDGAERRIAHIWGPYEATATEPAEPARVQYTEGGSFYLGNGYLSMSGGLEPGIPGDTLTLTEEKKSAGVWFFHHNWSGAGRGVNATIDFRVFEASVPTNTKWCSKCNASVPGTHQKGDWRNECK